MFNWFNWKRQENQRMTIVESEWMKECECENETLRECESERLTFEPRHENKSCSACLEGWISFPPIIKWANLIFLAFSIKSIKHIL